MTALSVPRLFHRSEMRDRVALVTKARTYTFAEMAAMIDRVADGLWALGVRKGDRVALHITNGPHIVSAIFACWKLGAVVAFVDVFYAAARVVPWCNIIEAKCLIVDETRWAQVAPYLESRTSTPLLLSTGDHDLPPGVLPWSTLTAPHPAAPPVEVGPDDYVLMFHTSGTTAMPKGVLHTLASLDARLPAHAGAHPLGPDDVMCPMSPMSTVAGLNATSVLAWSVGARVVALSAAYDVAVALEQMVEVGATCTMAGPPRVLGLVQAARARPELARTKLRFAMTGGDKLPESTRRAWEETFRGVPLLEGYGLSETLSGVLINRLEEEGQHAGNVGRPFPGVEIELRDPRGRVVAPGAQGELWLRCPYLFREYWREPERTREVLVDGWFRTGDQAVVDERGHYRILGRNDYLILRGTINISPMEVEAVAEKFPGVRDCMAAGYPNELLGADVEVFLVTEEAFSLKEFAAYMLEHMGAAMNPSRYFRVPAIPRTSQDKVDRKAAASLRASATLLE